MAKKVRTIKIYKTYHFKDQDPIVAKLRTVVKDEAESRGISVKQMANTACDLSGVAKGTKNNWYSQKTKRPQFATLNAFARAIDRELDFVNRKK
jgi:hypothetical protein